MFIYVKRLVVVGLVFAFVFTISPTALGKAQPSGDPEQAALSLVAEQNNLPVDRLEVANSTETVAGVDDTTVYAYKFVDTRSGEVYGGAVDAAGNLVDVEALEAEKQATYEAQYGRVHPMLVEAVSKAEADASIRVIIWTYEPVPAKMGVIPEGPEYAADVEEARVAVGEARAAAVAQAVAPVADRLAGMGYSVGTNETSAFVYTALPASMIQEVAAWPEVRQVYLDEINESDLGVAGWATGLYQTFRQGFYTGRGAEFAINEVSHGPYYGNQWLTGDVTWDTTYIGACTYSDHEHTVLGIIYSANRTSMGFATGASGRVGGSCNGYSSELQAQANAAASWGADVINNSWGSDTNLVFGSNDIFYDDYAYTRYVLPVKSAGNRGGVDNEVTSPGLAYNMLTVGAFDDRNSTIWLGTYPDLMASYSSYFNPDTAYDDSEKPEVVMPGSNIVSTNASGGVADMGSGTSYAAPMMTGMITAILNHGNYNFGPVYSKAIAIASATHDLDNTGALGTSKDGAGSPYAVQMMRIREGTSGGYGMPAYSCATSDPYDATTIPLVAGKKTRIAISWLQDTSATNYPSRPMVDLDLEVLDPGGVLISYLTFTKRWTYVWDSTYEWVEWTPTVTGNYTIRLNRYGTCYIPSSTTVAYAWWRAP